MSLQSEVKLRLDGCKSLFVRVVFFLPFGSFNLIQSGIFAKGADSLIPSLDVVTVFLRDDYNGSVALHV